MAQQFDPTAPAFMPGPVDPARSAAEAFAAEAQAAGALPTQGARQRPPAAPAPQGSFTPQAPAAPVPQRQSFTGSPVTGAVPQRTATGAIPGVTAGSAPSVPSSAAPATAPGTPPARPAPGQGVPSGTGQTPGEARAGGAPRPSGAEPSATRRLTMSQESQGDDLNLQETLRAMLKLGASDLHITSGSQPMVRVDGELTPVEGTPKLNPEGLRRTLYSILTQKQRETFEEKLELDLSYALVGEARFRVNLYQQRDSVGAAFRVIPYEIKPLEALGVPPTVANFAGKPRGLVLVTGPTGSGKSTTLASLIDLVNRNRAAHIMTVEDPIEFLHRHKKSLVNQREVGADTHSFANALKHVLRQDPDVILIGELRDLETIQVALTAAETGHLVFGTLHTQDTAQTIDRIIDVFPAEQQAQVRTQLGTAIQGVMCQALCKRADGPGRAVAVEVMVATPAIRNLIREGKTHQIYSMLQSGSRQGMQTMDQHLAELVKQGRISYETGVETCHNFEDFNRLTGRADQPGMGGGH